MVESEDRHFKRELAPNPSDFLRELKEPESRTPMYGIGIGSSDTRKYHNVLFLEPCSEGYQVHMSVVDPISPKEIQYFGVIEGSVKAITITTNLDREVETTGFSVGFTDCVSMGLFTEEQIGTAVLDPSHELHALFTDFYKIAKALQEERIANGALDPYMSLSRDVLSKRKSDNKKFEIGRTIRDEFLHLCKSSIAKKFSETGVNALYENSDKADGAIDKDVLHKRMLEFVKNPTFDEASYLRYMLGSIAPWSRTEVANTGNYFYGKDAHLKYTQPHTHLSSYINLVILHSLCLGEDLPYSKEELEAAADLVNQGKTKMKKPLASFQKSHKTDTEKPSEIVQAPHASRFDIPRKKGIKRRGGASYDSGRVIYLLDEIAREKQRRS